LSEPQILREFKIIPSRPYPGEMSRTRDREGLQQSFASMPSPQPLPTGQAGSPDYGRGGKNISG